MCRSILSSTDIMSQLKIDGRLYGKQSTTPIANETRAILPATAILRILDSILDYFLTPIVNALHASLPDSYYAGGCVGTQTLDIAHGAHLTIEKGLDRHSAGAVAQADVRKFFDRLKVTLIANYLDSLGVHGCLTGALVRFHSCVQVDLNFAGHIFSTAPRSRGILTGTRTALALSRIPLFDIVSRRCNEWLRFGFKLSSSRICLASWIDNLFTFSHNAADAIAILKDIEISLASDWHLEYGADSLKFVTCREGDTDGTDARWSNTPCSRILGHIVSDDSSCDTCFKATCDAMWRCFYANCTREHLGCSTIATGYRLRLLNRCILPIMTFRSTRWPFTSKKAATIDRMQAKMIAHILSLKPTPDEPIQNFHMRVARTVGVEVKALGRWSCYWATYQIRWAEHLERESVRGSFIGRIYACQREDWLQQCRRVFLSSTRSLWAGGTGTRVANCAPKVRWERSIMDAKTWLDRWGGNHKGFWMQR